MDESDRRPDAGVPANPPAVGEDVTRTLAGPLELGASGGANFRLNQIVAERFRIAKFIGQGGMGEVYEAFDLELREPVALKTIRPQIAEDERTIARFKQEIQLARRVTHPNVCRIFDLFRHRPASPEQAESEVTFLTMELLRGETLSSRLRREGRVPPAEATSIASQLASALAAAHRAGVIHRDFKTGNVMLTTAREGAGVRAVVTDFGLACNIPSGEQESRDLTVPGGMVGTPAYMAPEQIEGGEVSPQTDIYALGLVLFEMLTGRQPFEASSTLGAVVRRLKEPAPSPRIYVPDLDPQWEEVILRCLERDPSRRFATADEVLHALQRGQVGSGEPRATRVRRRLALAALAALLPAAGILIYELVQRTSTPAPAKARPSVAVLGFRNLSGRTETAWLSGAFSELLTTELSAGGKILTIPGENVARMKAELSLADVESLAKDTLERIRKNLGTDFVLLGSYLTVGGKIRLDVRLQDAVDGQTAASVSETGTEQELLALISRTGADLRRQLGAGELSAAEQGGLQASYPSNAEAARLYSEGLAKLRLAEAEAARRLLEQAVAADPRHALSHAALAAAWSALGYGEKARAAAKQALDLSAPLAREERLWVEGGYREITQEWMKAAESYRSLFTFFPDNLEYGLRLAAAQTLAGRAAEALATAEQLRRLPAPASEDPRIDLAEANAARSTSDFRRQQLAAERAVSKAAAKHAPLLAARGLLVEGSALWSLGDPKAARERYEEALRTFREAADLGGVAQAEGAIGNLLYRQGDLEGAMRRYEKALATERSIGNNAAAMNTLNSMAALIYSQGKLAEAKQMFTKTVAVARETENRGRLATALNNLGGVNHSLGDLATARKLYEEALEINRATGSQRGIAIGLTNLGEVLIDSGDLPEARRTLERALEIRRRIGDKDGEAYALNNLARLRREQAEPAEAEKASRQARRISEELKARANGAQARRILAEVLLDQGRGAEAEAEALEAGREFEALRRADDKAAADAVLARILLARGKAAEARAAIAGAVSHLRRTENVAVRLGVRLAQAQVSAQSGRMQEALRTLNEILAGASKAGLTGLQYEARLALGELEIKSGKPGAGRARLEALEKDAAARGFIRIARRSAAKRG